MQLKLTTSTLQSASLPNSNLTPDEQKALKRLKTDENIVILPADKGRVTVVKDKTDYNDKMDSLILSLKGQTDLRSTQRRPDTHTATQT